MGGVYYKGLDSENKQSQPYSHCPNAVNVSSLILNVNTDEWPDTVWPKVRLKQFNKGRFCVANSHLHLLCFWKDWLVSDTVLTSKESLFIFVWLCAVKVLHFNVPEIVCTINVFNFLLTQNNWPAAVKWPRSATTLKPAGGFNVGWYVLYACTCVCNALGSLMQLHNLCFIKGLRNEVCFI